MVYFCGKPDILDTLTIIFIVSMVIFLAGGIAYIIRYRKLEKKQEIKKDMVLQMQLQAYERLMVLADRIALPNLINRLNESGVNAREMQAALLHNIRTEFDYNITQQIYVSAEAWNALKSLKEQNQLIINQFSNSLAPDATGLDLNRVLLQFLMNDRKGTLHEMVGEVLSIEAKKVMVV